MDMTTDTGQEEGPWQEVQRQKKKQVKPPGEAMDTLPQQEVRKNFRINIGQFATEAEVLTVLHMEYAWIQLKRRTTRSRAAILSSTHERTCTLLAEMEDLNGKTVSFPELSEEENTSTYVMIDVPLYVPTELFKREEEVIDAERMSKWDSEKKQKVPANMVKIVLKGKQHKRFSRSFGSYRLRPFIRAPMQCFNCQKFGHQARCCTREAPVCRYCAKDHNSALCKEDTTITLLCANCKENHATTSRLCTKKLAAEDRMKRESLPKKEVLPKKTLAAPLINPWNKRSTFIPREEDFPVAIAARKRPFLGPPPTINVQKPALQIAQKNQHEREPAQGSQMPEEIATPVETPLGRRSETAHGEPQKRPLSGQLPRQPHQIEDPVIETINLALQGAASLIQRIAGGKRELIPALKKIVSAAMDALECLEN